MQCEIRGMVEVRGWHDAPIMWPLTWEPRKRRTLIVTGDLIRALENESVTAICHHWSVGRTTMQRWKAALKIGHTERSKEIRREICGSMAQDEHANERRKESITPARMANLHAHPRGPRSEAERKTTAMRMSRDMLALQICPRCKMRRTERHINAHTKEPNAV